MWGVENGRDNLMLGGDIHYDNPAEEVNLFDVNKPGRDYGYPHCWSEGIWMDTAMAKGPGTQHLDPDQPGSYTEAKCRTETPSCRPRSRWARTSAPLDIIEYRGAGTRATCRATCSSRRTVVESRDRPGRPLIIHLKMGANGPTESQNFLGARSPRRAARSGDWGSAQRRCASTTAGLLAFSE